MSSTTGKNDGEGGGDVASSAADPPPWSELAPLMFLILSAMVAARCLAAVFRISTLLVPLLVASAMGFYLFSTCPATESFDGKRELRIVLKGYETPKDHPNKPKGFLGKAMTKLSTSIEAEAAALAAVRVEMLNVGGVFKIASIQDPFTKKVYFWLGAIHKWRFIVAKYDPIERTKRE